MGHKPFIVIGALLVALGFVPVIGSARTPIYNIHALIPMLWGWTAILMGWVVAPRRAPSGASRIIFLLSLIMVIAGSLAWAISKKDPIYKVDLFMFPILPGCYVAIMSWISMVGVRTKRGE